MTGQSYTYDDLVASMRSNGWKGDAVDVVRMPDGKLTSMDNTRITAAREAGIDVRATVRSFDEVLTPEMKNARGWGNYSTWGTGPIRIDFAVPEKALSAAGKSEWLQMFQPMPSTPIYNVLIHVPPGTRL